MLLRLLLILVLLFAGAPPSFTQGLPKGEQQKKEETVAFNTKSLKYHCLRCQHAKRCTRNCIDVPISEAKERGGVACKHCGGTCGRR